jgi:hypothetical protein
MRRLGRAALTLLTLASVSVTVAGCDDDSEESSASCPSVVEFDGDKYGDAPSSPDLPTEQELGKGQLLGCDDAPGEASPGEVVEVWSLAGVDPAQAIGVTLGDHVSLFVAASLDDPCVVKYNTCHSG